MMDALVLSCGGTIDPLIKSIKKYQPDLVYFLHSEQSFYHAMYILSIFDYNLSYNCKLVKDYQDINEVFVKSRELINELKEKNFNIRVDFTGGTKAMSAGLVLASVGQGCKHSYIGTDDFNGRDKNGVGAVLSGHEFIMEQEDPFEAYAVFEFERGKEFFDEYQFKAAKVNFEDAIQKTTDDGLKRLATIYVEIVKLYDIWDKFELRVSKKVKLFQKFNTILNEINKNVYLRTYFSKNHKGFINQMIKNKKFLEKKIPSSKNKRITPENTNYYLPDLLNNAQRRIFEGKYDDAVARLYRAIELIAQIQLAQEGFINENILQSNLEFKIKKSEIKSLPNDLAIKHKILTCYEFNKDPNKDSFGIGSFKSYKLLEGLGFAFANEYINDTEIENNIKSRNRSILAHGLTPIKDVKKVNDFYNQVVNYAYYVCPNVEKCINYSKFPKFNVENVKSNA